MPGNMACHKSEIFENVLWDASCELQTVHEKVLQTSFAILCDFDVVQALFLKKLE